VDECHYRQASLSQAAVSGSKHSKFGCRLLAANDLSKFLVIVLVNSAVVHEY
jgi:hypothetical protein